MKVWMALLKPHSGVTCPSLNYSSATTKMAAMLACIQIYFCILCLNNHYQCPATLFSKMSWITHASLGPHHFLLGVISLLLLFDSCSAYFHEWYKVKNEYLGILCFFQARIFLSSRAKPIGVCYPSPIAGDAQYRFQDPTHVQWQNGEQRR